MTDTDLDEREVLQLRRKYSPQGVDLEPVATEAKDPAARWVGGSTNGERRFIDDTELLLLDQLDRQVATRDTLLGELEAASRRRSSALHAYEVAQRNVREAELVARGTRAGFEVLAKRNVPRPDRMAK